MPLICVPRYVVSSPYIEGATQFIEGDLTFAGTFTIKLTEAVFGETGDYVLFEYTGSLVGGTPSLANISVDASALELSQLDTLVHDSANKRIILKLRSRATNGKQFIEGDLTFTGSTTVLLSKALYKTRGTYELFEVTGTITGLAFLSVTSMMGYSASAPYLDGTDKKVLVDLT